PGPDGKLAYKTTDRGDRVLDFSHAGYMGGGVALPAVPVKRTVTPSGGADDTAAIQAALDEVAALPPAGRVRGAVRLAPGTFRCSGTVTIAASGVVLRGSGSGAAGGPASTIQMTDRPHLAVAVRGPRDGGDAPDPAFRPAQTSVADAYVPSGAPSFTVADAAGFAAGDTIAVRRPGTAA